MNERAKQVLAQLEAEHLDDQGKPKAARSKKKSRKGDIQLTLFAAYDHPLLDTIRDTDINALTPIDALQLIQRWQEELRE